MSSLSQDTEYLSSLPLSDSMSLDSALPQLLAQRVPLPAQANPPPQQAVSSQRQLQEEGGVASRMRSFDMPFEIGKITVPELGDKLTGDLCATSYPAEYFWKYFELSVDDIPVVEFRKQSHHLTVPIADFTQNIQTNQPLDNTDDRCLPPIGLLDNEQQVADYLNDIVISFDRHRRSRAHRNYREPIGYWSAAQHNKILPVGPYKSKPDVMLLPLQDGRQVPADQIAWPDVLCVGEKTSTRHNTRSIKNTSVSRAYMMLYTQGDRDQVTTFSINGKSFFVQIVDREGVISIGPMYYETHTNEFLALILSLSFLRQGYDETMTRHLYTLPTDALPFPPQTAPSQLTFNWKRTTLPTGRSLTGINLSSATSTLPFPVPSSMPPPVMGPSSPTTLRSFSMPPPPPFQVSSMPPPPPSQVPSMPIPPPSQVPSMPPPPPSQVPSMPPPASSMVHVSNGSSARGSKRKISNRTTGSEPVSEADIKSNAICNIKTIHCNGKEYTIVREIFRSRRLTGRATRVWEARDEQGAAVIIKESWILQGRKQSEAGLIENARAPQIPEVVNYMTTEYSTGTHRQRLELDSSTTKHREKRRVVEKPVGSQLSTIRSYLELLSAFLDYAKGIKYLRDHNRMHRDISANNLMLYEADFEDPVDEQSVIHILRKAGCRRGLLIDFDYASFIDPHIPDPLATPLSSSEANIGANLAIDSLSSGPSTALRSPAHDVMQIDDFGVRTGTAPFMAIHLLMNPTAPHCVGYDLESLFYVLVFIVTQIDDFSKPDNQKFRSINLPKPISSWFLPHIDLETLGEIKTAQFHSYFEKRILCHVKPMFEPLVPVLKRIWKALYPTWKTAEDPPEDCCDVFIDAIEGAIFNVAKTMGQAMETIGQADVSNTLVMPEEDAGEATSDHVPAKKIRRA